MAGGRGRVGTAGALAAAAIVAGCGGGTDPSGPDPTSSAVGASDVCRAEERPPLQAGAHLIGDTDPPVPYSSVPPTSGWHASGAPDPGVHREPLSDPEVVALLEIGQVVAVYDPSRLDADEVAELEEIAGSTHPQRLSVTPANEPLPTPLTLTAWGVLQRCDGVAPEDITRFVLSHHGRTGEEH